MSVPLASGVSRFRAGALASLLSQVIQMAGRIALVPLFLGAWGKVGYGEWLSLSAVVAYLTVLDLGLQNHVVNRLCRAWMGGDTDDYRRVLHTALIGSLMVCGATLVVLTAVAMCVPWSLTLDSLSSRAAIGVAILLAAQVLAAIPCGIVIGVYRTVGEYPRGMMIGNLRGVLFLLSTAAVLLQGGGPVAVAAAQLAPMLLTVLVALRDLRRRHPHLPLQLHGFDGRLARALLVPSLGFLAIQGAMLLSLQGSTLLVYAGFGAAMVTVFATLRTLANLVRQISGCLGNTLWPQATELYARGQFATLRAVHRLAAKLIVAATLAVAVALWFVGADVVTLWTAGRVSADPQLLLAFLAHLAGQATWVTSSVLLMAWGCQRVVALCCLLSGAGGLIFGWALSRYFGVAGLVWGMCLVDLLVCGIALPLQACRELAQDPAEFAVSVLLRGLPCVVAICLLAHGVDRLLAGHGPWRIVLLPATLLPLAAWLVDRLWLDRGERQRVRRLLGLADRVAAAPPMQA